MALLGIDELNLIDTYFDEMELSEEDKQNRVDLCEDLFYIYYYIFALISTDFRLKKAIDVKEYTDKLSERFKAVLDATEYADLINDEEITNYIDDISKNLVESTLRNLPVEDEEDNLDDIVRPASPYWSSTERAIRVAEDMTNVIANHKELQDKIAEGYTHKTWVSILDTHTRESHWLAWGKTVPINKPFTIGSSLMMCPCDHTAPAKEIVNCRCKLAYSIKEEILERKLPTSDSEIIVDLQDYKGDTVRPHNIKKDLQKTDIGKEALEWLKKYRPSITISYEPLTEKSKNTYGFYNPLTNKIKIYALNTKTVHKTASVLVHELTHCRNRAEEIYTDDFGNEFISFYNDNKHLYGRELTEEDINAIVKTINEMYGLYGDYTKWIKL